jgi:hypothetical protein
MARDTLRNVVPSGNVTRPRPQKASAEPLRECPHYPKSGRATSPLKESAKCHEQT